MSRQFRRACELVITTASGRQISIREVRITFQIIKSVISTPNLAEITIYNLSHDTESALQDRFNRVTFNAGYEGNIKLLFTGEVRNVSKVRQGVDRTVTLYASDGERDFQNASFNRTYSASVQVSKAIRDIMATFTDATIGTLEGLPDVTDKLRGMVLSGTSRDLLDMLADEYGFNWSIQNGEVIATPRQVPLTTREAVYISSSTGMLGTPSVTEIGADVTTLLNPLLLPGVAFQIDTNTSTLDLEGLLYERRPRTDANGLYVAQEVTFQGDNKEGNWISIARGALPNGVQ